MDLGLAIGLIIAALFVGAIVGAGAMALCASASWADRHLEDESGAPTIE